MGQGMSSNQTHTSITYAPVQPPPSTTGCIRASPLHLGHGHQQVDGLRRVLLGGALPQHQLQLLHEAAAVLLHRCVCKAKALGDEARAGLHAWGHMKHEVTRLQNEISAALILEQGVCKEGRCNRRKRRKAVVS